MLDSARRPDAERGPRASLIYRPGLRAMPVGTERYQVSGAGSAVIQIRSGDQITVTDLEGLQPCEICFVDRAGRFDTSALGAAESTEASGLKSVLAAGGSSAKRILQMLERRNVSLAQARALRLFGETSPAGNAANLHCSRDGMLIVAVPGPAMSPHGQDTATPIDLRVQRVHPALLLETGDLPAPLADPLQDLRIKTATARAYFVRKGEYIQIIDVAGRQCTDFQCFSARKLDKGRQLGLDATATRTLLGRAYPAPGLTAKAFDADFEPLVEVVQDTCGRHDAFITACNPRYYDDLGYPGHVNCTENFNAVLSEYDIAPRRGWEALNYFNNTFIDARNQLYLDEPWSRPGDYILMRALTDLVCVTSACPDDIDPANGWNPTDIHVRTYSDKATFSRAVAFRMTPDAEPQMTRETAFHPRFSAMTRNYTEYRGYWLPARFNDGAIDEYWACRERAVVMDLSALRKFEINGPDAETLLQYCLTRDVRRLSEGQVVYSAMCYENGGMLDDGTLYRLGQNNFRWICGDDYSGIWLREQAERLGLHAWVRSSTDQLHNIAVQGPKSQDILKEIIWTAPAQPSLEELGWFHFAVGRIGGFDGVPIVVSRTGYTGELGYEIFCHPRDAGTVFDAVWEAGQPHGMRPLGLDALDILRIEAGLAFPGFEFTDQVDPFEAGIGFTVPLDKKPDDFIGREALVRRKENPRQKMVGLEIDSNDAVGHGDCVHIGRGQIGVVTSAARSPLLRANIALARVDAMHAEIGTAVEIGKLDGQQKRLPARIVRFPHYDPDKTRPRS